MSRLLYFAGAFFIIIIIILLVEGCAVKQAKTLDCRTETTITRICDSTGTGTEIVISPRVGDATD